MRLDKYNLDLQKKIEDQIIIEKDEINKKQLASILYELKLIYGKNNCLLSFSHTIIDSWDMNKELAKELLNFANIYEKNRELEERMAFKNDLEHIKQIIEKQLEKLSQNYLYYYDLKKYINPYCFPLTEYYGDLMLLLEKMIEDDDITLLDETIVLYNTLCKMFKKQ